jgi:predicted nucleic acid-binding protein
MRHFFDTNVLVYTRDPEDPVKQARARALIERAIEEGAFVLSTQVLLEFYATALRRRLLGPSQALALVRFWGSLDVVPHSAELIARGLELHQAHRLSVWDGLIVQAALDAGCDVLFSEDLQHGRRFGALEVVNPFAAGGTHEPDAPAYGAGVSRKRSREAAQASPSPARPGPKGRTDR